MPPDLHDSYSIPFQFAALQSYLKECSAAEIFPRALRDEIFDCGDDLFQIGVAFDEFGREVLEQTQHVMDHQHLPVALRARADADGGVSIAGR